MLSTDSLLAMMGFAVKAQTVISSGTVRVKGDMFGNNAKKS